MNNEKKIYSRCISQINLTKDKFYSKQKNDMNKRIFNIYSRVIKPKINNEFILYSTQLNNSKLRKASLSKREIKNENYKYFHRIFPDLNNSSSNNSKKCILPKIKFKSPNNQKNKIKKSYDNIMAIKKVKVIIKKPENQVKAEIKPLKIKIKMKKKNENRILDEIIKKSKEEQIAEEEAKKNEEKEIREGIERNEKIKKEINEQKKNEEKIKFEIRKQNEIKYKEYIKEVEIFKKEQETINKKNTEEILNIDISKIEDKNIKYQFLKDLELLIRHGQQLNIESQNKLSNEINKLISNFDNKSFEFIINIINAMINVETNFNKNLIKNFIEILYKIPNIDEKIYENSLRLLVKINKEIGIIDESENLYWNSLTNKKLFSISIEGLHHLIQNCYGCDTDKKFNQLIEIFNNYKDYEEIIKNYLCNIIKNISINEKFQEKIFISLLNVINKIDFKDRNFDIFSNILLNIFNSTKFNKNLIFDNNEKFLQLIIDGKINENILMIINYLKNKTNIKIINDFIKFNENIINGININSIKDYIFENNPKPENMEYLLPYIMKNLDKEYFIKLLYSIVSNNKLLYKNINISALSENMNLDIEATINIIDDGILFMDKSEIKNIFMNRFENIIFSNSGNIINKYFDLIIKFFKKNKDLLTNDLNNLLQIYDCKIINKKISELIKNLFLSKSHLPDKILIKLISSKFDSNSESDIYDLLEIIIAENCKVIKQKLGNKFLNLCDKVLDNNIINIPKLIKTFQNNNINLGNYIYKLLIDKLNKRMNYYFEEKKEIAPKYLILCLMRYFKFDELDNSFQNYLICNINKLCSYNNKCKNRQESIDKEFNSKYLYKLFIYYILESDIYFNKKKIY